MLNHIVHLLHEYIFEKKNSMRCIEKYEGNKKQQRIVSTPITNKMYAV